MFSLSRTRKRWQFAAAAFLLPLTLILAAPAQAATEASPPAGEQCFVPYETQQIHCIPAGEDINAAISAETGYPVLSADDAASRPADADGTNGTTATVIIGYIWENEYYGGTYLYFTANSASTLPCWGYTYGFPYLGNFGWHDRADSMQGESSCRMNLYSDPNYGGVQTGFVSSAATLGLLHDNGDSLIFGN